jgi:DNA-binding NtrC family response regulator
MIEQRIAPGRGYPFDLILVDWNLQGSDATEVLQVCTGLASGVPVVIMTGHITHSLQVALQKGGPLMFLLKPITADNIVILFRQFQIPFVRESDVDRKKQS